MGQFAFHQTIHPLSGSLHSPLPTTTGLVDLQPVPVRPEQSQRKDIQGSGSTHNNQTLSSNQYRNQISGFRCGYTRDQDLGPRVPGIPVQSPPMGQVANSYRNIGQSEPWMDCVLGVMDPSPPSSDWDTDLSESAFIRSFKDYDFPAAEVSADPGQTNPGGNNFKPLIQPPSVALPCSVPTGGSDRSQRTFACLWRAEDALCNSHVISDRRSVVEHLQTAHGVKPGDEKAREPCHWEHCRIILNKESLARHILTVHLKEGARCPDCRVVFAREDSLKRHLKGGLHSAPSERGTRQSPS